MLLLNRTSASIKDEWLSEPFLKLLRVVCSWRHVKYILIDHIHFTLTAFSVNNWIEQGLVKEYAKRGTTSPFDPDAIGSDAFNLDTQQRLAILADLCEWLLQSSDALRSFVPDHGAVLRLEPISGGVFE